MHSLNSTERGTSSSNDQLLGGDHDDDAMDDRSSFIAMEMEEMDAIEAQRIHVHQHPTNGALRVLKSAPVPRHRDPPPHPHGQHQHAVSAQVQAAAAARSEHGRGGVVVSEHGHAPDHGDGGNGSGCGKAFDVAMNECVDE